MIAVSKCSTASKHVINRSIIRPCLDASIRIQTANNFCRSVLRWLIHVHDLSQGTIRDHGMILCLRPRRIRKLFGASAFCRLGKGLFQNQETIEETGVRCSTITTRLIPSQSSSASTTFNSLLNDSLDSKSLTMQRARKRCSPAA